jgi:hypothetical protein
MRHPGFTAPGLLTIAVLLLIGVTGMPVAARQGATPAAGTPEVVEIQPVETPAQPAAAAAATPAPAAAATDVVTLVLWYQNAADQDIITLHPIETDAGFVAGPARGGASVGTADFPEEGVPTVVVGDTTFETYPRPDGVIERWTWLDDIEGARPGTLVMQLAGLDGTYQNYFGTATFVSRDEGGSGGVLTIVLRPPSPAAVAQQDAAAPGVDDAAAGDAAVADETTAPEGAAVEAAEPEATVDPGTDILVEPGNEGEVPVTDGEEAVEPAA